MQDSQNAVQDSQNTVQGGRNVVHDGQNSVQDGQNAVQDGQNCVQDGLKSIFFSFASLKKSVWGDSTFAPPYTRLMFFFIPECHVYAIYKTILPDGFQ